MFVISLKYVKPIQEVEKCLENHIKFLEKYYASGNFICSGRKNPRIGGVIICLAKDRMEAESIIQEDPFFIEKLAEYEVIEFLPTKYAEGFERFIEKV